jgi:hypothetical protein
MITPKHPTQGSGSIFFLTLSDLIFDLKGEPCTVHILEEKYLGPLWEWKKAKAKPMNVLKIQESLWGDFPEVIEDGTTPTPASEHLLDVRPDQERTLLNEEQTWAFHHTLAQLLFASTRSRKDIQKDVSFLTTRIKQPDEDDWGGNLSGY